MILNVIYAIKKKTLIVDIFYLVDDLILCDLCNCCTHYTCYGSELLQDDPEGVFYKFRILVLLKM